MSTPCPTPGKIQPEPNPGYLLAASASLYLLAHDLPASWFDERA